jgi:uncharacterized protein (TIGR02145 family)
MKSICKNKIIFMACVLIIVNQSCKKELPELITSPVNGITATTANCGGKIKFEGEPKFTICGICWDTKENPTIKNTRTGHKAGSDEFVNTITGLIANTTYYARAYATSSAGTAYGEQVKFTSATTVPVLLTSFISDIRSNTASVGNIIVSDGGSGILKAGVCWDTLPGPTTDGSKTIDNLHEKVFLSHLSGLSSNKTYFVRAYAANSVGTAYGEEKTVKTTTGPEIKGLKKLFSKGPNRTPTETPVSTPTSNTVINKKDSSTRSVKVRSVVMVPHDQKTLYDSVKTENVTDIDKNVYNSVTIGSQVWMKENLKVTRYRDGTPIPNITDNKEWSTLTKGSYCWYSNDQANANSALGALYNWYAVVDTRQLCPDGWHVATDADWKTLEIFLGTSNNKTAGTGKRVSGKASDIKNATGWIKQGKGTNATDFSALAAGFRFAYDGKFSNQGLDGCWWTASEDKGNFAWLRNMYFYLTDIYRVSDNKNSGFSVRCIREK